VPEPAGGAHTDPAAAAENLREYLRRYLDELSTLDAGQLGGSPLHEVPQMGNFFA